jgi:hypothetical protein
MKEERIPPGGARSHDVPDEILEIWLEHRLRWLYGAVLAEPVPPELLRILEEKPAPPVERGSRKEPSRSPA